MEQKSFQQLENAMVNVQAQYTQVGFYRVFVGRFGQPQGSFNGHLFFGNIKFDATCHG